MSIWRMSFRCGDRGPEMWPQCFKLGVAAIYYTPLAEVDLSKYPQREPKHLWAQLKPTQNASLRRVAYEMKKGDVIYVKQGTKIVGRGIVKRRYKFDYEDRMLDPDGNPWAHQVPVKWELGFQPINILLGSEPMTVLPLREERLRKLEKVIDSTKKSVAKQEVLEGEKLKAETTFRKRNRALIEAKKANSNGRCEVCNFSFEKGYGGIGKGHIIAHHINPIGGRKRASRTTLDDIALVCSNCHDMLHKKNPPMSIQRLRRRLKVKWLEV